MTSLSSAEPISIGADHSEAHFNRPLDMRSVVIILAIAAGGLIFAAYNIYSDVKASQAPAVNLAPFLLLGAALVVALGFEFVNGFHDTANAVATVIYTHSMPARFAVVWSGGFNFLGVLFSTGLVAFGIISLLPVELILQIGSSAGYAMVFAMLIAAVIWNVGTWSFGLPASSSHTLIGSIVGVGVANALMNGREAAAGVDWSQAASIGYVLLVSPIVGFIGSALLLLAMKFLVRKPELYTAPEGDTPPPLWIRGLLVLTCTGVSFAHGSNDGQKGMGLIMLILIGTVPTAYALNRAVPANHVEQFIEASEAAATVVDARGSGHRATDADSARERIAGDVAARMMTEAAYPSLALLIRDIAKHVGEYGSLDKIPAAAVGNTRNNMYLASEAIGFLVDARGPKLFADETKALDAYKRELDNSTKFIPNWVKICVALALGLGTMIGWSASSLRWAKRSARNI